MNVTGLNAGRDAVTLGPLLGIMPRAPKVGPLKATLLAVPVPPAVRHGQAPRLMALPARHVDDGRRPKEAKSPEAVVTGPARLVTRMRTEAAPAPEALHRPARPVPPA